jgi:hypothetical protein
MWLDYYLIQPDALLVEEFVLAEDGSATRLDSAWWSPADRQWRSSAACSRELRVDAGLRSRASALHRAQAQAHYRRYGGGDLPDEQALRTYFQDGLPLAVAPMLRLTDQPDGTGLYRILFANEPRGDALASLRALRSTGAGADDFTWELRRIGAGRVGAGIAWCVDVTARVAGVAPLLGRLSSTMREHGLIPVTIDRFA